MMCKSTVCKPLFLSWADMFAFFFHGTKRTPAFCLITTLVWALFVPGAVAQSSTNIPVFQFAIFYNLDLEIAAAQTMIITGPVFSDGGLWSGSTTITFANTVSAVGLATNTPYDPFCTGYIGSGLSHYSLAGQPTSSNAPLTMALVGTNSDPAAVEALINLPPTNYAMNTAAAFTSSGQFYLANQADLYLTNFPSGTNWGSLTPRGTNLILYYQDAANGPSNYLTRIPYDFYLLTNRANHTIFSANNVTSGQITNVWYAGYSFATNVIFYDWREGWNGGSGIGGRGKTVQAVQIDIAKFNGWLTNSGATNIGLYYNGQCKSHKFHPIDSIYVYNAVPLTGTVLPAVRLVNGGMLPSQTAPYGFTVVTAMPMYVYGNYNVSNSFGSSLGQNSTTYTWPAALMADSISILSGNWTDGLVAKMPTASSSTTIDAACLAGIVPSTNSMYSGGVENFLRTLEYWSGSALWYNGSIVAMFPSRYATNYWQQTGNYYAAPSRHWAFDTNFVNPARLPPCTPWFGNTTNPPVIFSQPQSQTISSGNNATFGVLADGSDPLSYQWSFNGTNIDAATNASLALTNLQFSQAGNYAVLVTNAYGSTLSSNAVLTVTATPPSIQVQPTNQTVFVNGTASFSVTAAGSLPLSYQWSLNGADLDGATNASLTLANVQTNQAGNYVAQMTNAFGSTNSTSVLLTVVGLPPTILTQPTNQTVFVNGTTTFTIMAGGTTPLNYQWSLNGTNLDGATNALLTLTNVQLSQAGNYAVQVANGFGSTNSSNAALSVVDLPPSIVTQPTNQTLVVEDTAIFIVTAAGFPPLNYQWSFNGTNLDGATNASLALTNVQFSQAGNYAVLVANAYGSILSSNAVLTVVGLPPTILTQPTNQTVFVNGSTSFAVVAGGTMPLNYQWSLNGTNLDGATNASLTLTNVQLSQAGNYSAQVANAFGSKNSSNAALSVVDLPPAIVIQPTNQVVIVEGTANFSVAVTGLPPLSYQWNFNGTNLDGATNASLALTNVQFSQAGNYAVLATNAYGSILSSNAMLTVNPPTPCVDPPVGLVAWWQAEGNANDSMGTNNGLLTNGITFTDGKVGQGFHLNGINQYIQIADSAALKPASVTVEAWVRLDVQVTPGANSPGQEFIVFKKNSRAGNFEGYSLLKNQVSGRDFFRFAIASSAGVQVKADSTTVPLVGVWYHLVGTYDGVTGSLKLYVNGVQEGSANPGFPLDYGTRPVFIGTTAEYWDGKFGGTVDEVSIYNRALSTNEIQAIYNARSNGKCPLPPTIVVQPMNQTNVVGADAAFNITAIGSQPLNYQWQLNGTNLVDATNATLTLNSVTTDLAGNYSVTVENNAGSITSSNAVLSVYASAAATLNGCSLSADNEFQFQVAGVPGFNYAVQESTNLIDWVSLITNASPFTFVDTNANNFPQQFYRTLYVP